MTTTRDDVEHGLQHPLRNIIVMLLAVAATVPGLYLRLSHEHITPVTDAALYGLAIVGAAFLLSWAAEVAQLDISAGLAIAVLAFIAVLPEYAVDLVFARKGGNAFEQHGTVCQSPEEIRQGVESSCSLALANMTGANRLLIGIGWTLVVFIGFFRYRARGERVGGVRLERAHSVELGYLTVATFYSLTLPLKRSITLFDAAILVGIFIAYTIRISRAPAEEPHLVGPATMVAALGKTGRRIGVVVLFGFAATVILLCAEHFAEALVEAGASANISEFLLVQWLAPLASEAPELLVAGLFAWRLNTNAGLGTLVSSKVNQWTLLVGTLPIVFALSSGSLHGLPIVSRQREELLLTAGQSLFAVAVLVNLTMSNKEALTLFVLFWAQFIVGAVAPENWQGGVRVGVGVVYIVLGLYLLLRDRSDLRRLLRDGFRTNYAQMALEEGPGTTLPPPAGTRT